MKSLLLFAVLLLSFVAVNAQNEYAPVVEKEIAYKDFKFKRYGDGKEMSLRELMKGKKLVMVTYFAPWCHTWQHQKPLSEKLYEKYKNQGLEIVGVSNYASLDELKANIGEKGEAFPVVIESEKGDDRDKTTHYAYRQLTGDTRKWGSPWSIFLEPSKINKKGDVLTEKAYVINGELIEEDTEKFIREKLGLPAEVKKETASTSEKKPEACSGEPAINFRKPN